MDNNKILQNLVKLVHELKEEAGLDDKGVADLIIKAKTRQLTEEDLQILEKIKSQ